MVCFRFQAQEIKLYHSEKDKRKGLPQLSPIQLLQTQRKPLLALTALLIKNLICQMVQHNRAEGAARKEEQFCALRQNNDLKCILKYILQT